MSECPECGGGYEVDEEYSTDDGQGMEYWHVMTCTCKDCGCVFELTETTEISYEVIEKGTEATA